MCIRLVTPPGRELTLTKTICKRQRCKFALGIKGDRMRQANKTARIAQIRHAECRCHGRRNVTKSEGASEASISSPAKSNPSTIHFNADLCSGVARIFQRGWPTFMGAPRKPLTKIENSSDLVHYFLRGAQNHEQEEKNIRLRGPILDLRAYRVEGN